MEQATQQPDGLQFAERGVGRLLQRDYWAVVRACRLSPEKLMEIVARHFAAFAPEELVVFRRDGGEPLSEGDHLDVEIVGAGHCEVSVVHRDAQSFTLATLPGHPEAGRITFGAYRNRRGDVIFHIRSRARSSSRTKLFGFLAMGEVMQTSTWTDFVNRVAVLAGEGVVGAIYSETKVIPDERMEVAGSAPTYLARGG